jgi:hypothetical protein
MAAGGVRLKLPPASSGAQSRGSSTRRQAVGRILGDTNHGRCPDGRRRPAYNDGRAARGPVVGVGARIGIPHGAAARGRVPKLGRPAVLRATGVLGQGRSRHHRHRPQHHSPNDQCPHQFALQAGPPGHPISCGARRIWLQCQIPTTSIGCRRSTHPAATGRCGILQGMPALKAVRAIALQTVLRDVISGSEATGVNWEEY